MEIFSFASSNSLKYLASLSSVIVVVVVAVAVVVVVPIDDVTTLELSSLPLGLELLDLSEVLFSTFFKDRSVRLEDTGVVVVAVVAVVVVTIVFPGLDDDELSSGIPLEPPLPCRMLLSKTLISMVPGDEDVVPGEPLSRWEDRRELEAEDSCCCCFCFCR